ncbi:uncharacterized protein [Amphiura filiformis]|uniref:uncharacterized protein n=1 Tax=Amphiura filiformis TaxID=82378 RepID=UPI003B21EE66
MDTFIFVMCVAALGSVVGDKCDFENGLCRFTTQDKNDGFNWSIGSSETPTAETGPSYDHTLGKDGKGHYIFIETSGKKPWTTARLSSRQYGPSKSTCVTFHYHMYGKDAGRLSVFLRQRGKLSAPIWSMTKDQGDEWIQVTLRTSSNINYQVVFEAARGSGFRSDIALDDITIVNGTCKGKALSIVSSTSPLDAVIGTKLFSSPGAEMLPHLLPSNNNGRQPNADVSPQITEVASTNNVLTNRFVINIMIVGLLFWAIVFILLCIVIWKSRGHSKKKYEEKVHRNTKVSRSAISTKVEFESQQKQQIQHPGYRADAVRNCEQSTDLYPKREPDDDEKWESFKSRAGLDKGESSFKDRYSLTTVDKDLYMYSEEERTAGQWRQSRAGDYV